MNVLTDTEQRVLGALVEKQISTPDYYPLTLNGLVNACNQKNHRDPVVEYDEAAVRRAVDGLRGKNLAFEFAGAEARVPKYRHNLPAALELAPAEVAVLTVLLLRGPQTAGELRSRTAHLFNFESLVALEETLQGLAARAAPLVVKLARVPGMREARFAHLLGGPVAAPVASAVMALGTPGAPAVAENLPGTPAAPAALPEPELADRVAKLESEVAQLYAEVEALKAKLADV